MSLKLNHEANYYYYKFGSTSLSLWNFFSSDTLEKVQSSQKGEVDLLRGGATPEDFCK